MQRKLKTMLVGVAVALLAVVAVLPAGAVQAAASSIGTGGNGLRVSPVRTDVTVSAGTSQTVEIKVSNVTSQAATFQAIVNDFTANPDESGNPAIILNPNQYASSHSLKRFVQPISDFSLAAGQVQTVPVVITVPKGAAGGGYYGVVRFAPAVTGSQNANVSLAGSVGSLILVTVPGNIVEHVQIASFDVREGDQPSTLFTTSKKLSVTVRLTNTGNVQEQPFGKIILENRSGKQLATYELNNTDPPGNVLPDSTRKFGIALDHVGSFGEFKLVGNFGYGNKGQLLSASTTFYVVPVGLIIVFIAVVILLLFIIFGVPRLIRAYNRSVVRRSRRH